MTFAHVRNIFIALCGASCVMAQPALCADAPADSVPRDDTVEKIAGWVRPIVRPGGGKWVVLPKITYSSEAGLGFGAEVARSFQWGALYAADSDIRMTGRITVQGDVQASATLNLGWLDKKYTFRTKIVYDDIPLSFYGIGPDTPVSNRETYQRQSIRYYVEVFRRVTKRFRLGVRGEFENNVMLEVEEGGLLDTAPVPGVGDDTVAGGGMLGTYDSRERRFSPRRGALYQFFWLQFVSVGSGNYEFNVINVDLRWYIPVRGSGVLAPQLFTYIVDQGAPFWRLAAIGGRSHSRGYRRGRYLDRVMTAAQLEYRAPLRGRLGFVGFGGIAVAAPDIEALDAKNIRPTLGLGLRFLIGRNGGKARVDVAYGADFRFYFRLDEAF